MTVRIMLVGNETPLYEKQYFYARQPSPERPQQPRFEFSRDTLISARWPVVDNSHLVRPVTAMVEDRSM